MANELIVGVADFKLSNQPGVIISTYALGSCIGVTLYDPVHHIGGMLHAMLPTARDHQNRSNRRFMFVDTGMEDFFVQLRGYGIDPCACECKVFGAAQVMQADTFFRIGEKNVAAFNAIVQSARLRLKVCEVGGNVNRTIKLYLENGMISVKTPNQEIFWR